MPVTDAQIQALIVLEVGDTPAGDLAATMPAIWDSYADKAQIAPRLQELYSKRRAVDIVIGRLRDQAVSFSAGADLSYQYHQKIDTLNVMRQGVEAEIAKVELKARRNRIPQAATITTTEPVTPPVMPPANPFPDVFDPRYAGSPYVPGVRPQR